MTEKKLPEFVKPGAVVRATDHDLTREGKVGEDLGGWIYTPEGRFLGYRDHEWTLVTPAPKTFDEKVADLLSVRIGKTSFTAGDAAVLRLLEDVDKAGLKLVEK